MLNTLENLPELKAVVIYVLLNKKFEVRNEIKLIKNINGLNNY